MQEKEHIVNKIKRIFEDSLLIEIPYAEVDLIQSNLIDSSAFMHLFKELEDEFAIEIDSNDLIIENFCKIDRIADFVMLKRSRLRD